jgi:hypothetical protein
LVAAALQVLQNDIDLLNPPAELEKLKHKKKRLVQSPNSFFMVLFHHLAEIFGSYVHSVVRFFLLVENTTIALWSKCT